MATSEFTHPLLTIDGKLELPAEQFHIREALSEVPTYSVSVMHDSDDLAALVGKPCVLKVPEKTSSGIAPRDFAGLVMAVERLLDADGQPSLKMTIRPPLAVLELSVSSAVYQAQTVVDIVKEVLKRNGLKREPLKVPGAKVKRDIVIQYNENDLDFVRRILAEEGLAFYYHDGKSPNTLVIHDVQNPFPKGGGKVAFTDARLSDAKLDQAHLLTLRETLRPDTVALHSYDPAKGVRVSAAPTKSSRSKTSQTPTVTEFRMTPIGKVTGNEIKVLKNAEQVEERRLSGACEHPALYLGQEISITSNEVADFADKYVITELAYRPTRGNALVCEFSAVPGSLVPAPARLPKPLIAGVHNAIVIGASSSAKAGDIACDALGRVKVEFFWDGAKAGSAYLRVAEPFAGAGYGAQFTPRVGHEVLVSFLHGDPDAPIITGQVYTEKNKPPYAAKNTTSSGIKTKLAGPVNELEFNDAKGSEMLALRAAKDFELIVPENVVRKIEKLETTTIGKDLSVSVTGASEFSSKSRSAKVDNADEVSAKEIKLTGSSKITLAVGANKIEISTSGIKISGTQVEIAGKSKVAITGTSKVDVKSNGMMNLSALSAKVAAQTALNLEGLQLVAKGKVQAKLEGPMAEVSGMGMMTVKGGIVMIN